MSMYVPTDMNITQKILSYEIVCDWIGNGNGILCQFAWMG